MNLKPKPRTLKTHTGMVATNKYDPVFGYDLSGGVQEVQIFYPFFLMSGVGMVSIKGPRFSGYLSGFVPDDAAEGECPTATVTVTPVGW